MSLSVALIDDEDGVDLASVICRLADEPIDVYPFLPPPTLDLREILEVNADISLVDYELDTSQADGSIAPYRGLTFASRLREMRPDHPIALLTRSGLDAWTTAQRTAFTAPPFDTVLYKEEHLRKDTAGTFRRLDSLAQGYSTLRGQIGRSACSVQDLLETLSTDGRAQRLALQALPPEDGWGAFEAADWIRNSLLCFPGILYDDRHAATALGISVKSFWQQPVLDLFRRAKYGGPFAQESRRWWRHVLFDIGLEVCAELEPQADLRETFYVAAHECHGIILERSVDAETGRAPADTVCYLLNTPTRIESSLPYRPDNRAEIMDQARVSFRAIREGNEVDENYIDSGSRQYVQAIRTGEI